MIKIDLDDKLNSINLNNMGWWNLLWTTYDDSRFKKTTNRYYVNVFSNLCIKFNVSELRCLNSHAFQTFYPSKADR